MPEITDAEVNTALDTWFDTAPWRGDDARDIYRGDMRNALEGFARNRAPAPETPTLHDLYAMHALQGLLANSDVTDHCTPSGIILRALDAATAIIAERSKTDDKAPDPVQDEEGERSERMLLNLLRRALPQLAKLDRTFVQYKPTDALPDPDLIGDIRGAFAYLGEKLPEDNQ